MQLTGPSRSSAIEVVTSTFLHRASRLTRLLAASGSRELSRTEAGLLTTLLDGPRRISELADSEALAQPTVTMIVNSLERRDLVVRERCAQDGRVVLVSISAPGEVKVESTRTQIHEVMRGAIEQLSDQELKQLVAASEILGRLIDSVQQRKASA